MNTNKFKSCPVCQDQANQCLVCGSYVVDGERIYYKELKNYGATQDHEIRFIDRIQNQKTIAFFHNGRLYIPSRQGRSVPLAIGLQWGAWQEQQSQIDQISGSAKPPLGKPFNFDLLDSYKDKIEQMEKQERIHVECINNLVQQKADYLYKVTKAMGHLDSFDHSRAGMNQLVRSIESALKALRGECE